ncbi:LOW QUALITY PROTEIN: hypothetical protein HID58_034459 [Brassica napus]|uniref:Myb/SANT-like domain-containing protein n=1 Tax=Brassica napus TaxID=3708 RepID=A0ABQ8C3E1_BRANA|nr:LOW QUALITY PROTEIN: hypothetical protein HID58_034459 [Brassica napus]
MQRVPCLEGIVGSTVTFQLKLSPSTSLPDIIDSLSLAFLKATSGPLHFVVMSTHPGDDMLGGGTLKKTPLDIIDSLSLVFSKATSGPLHLFEITLNSIVKNVSNIFMFLTRGDEHPGDDMLGCGTLKKTPLGMESNRWQSLNSQRQADINLPNETSARNGGNFKWTSSTLLRLLELYDQAADMYKYRIKDPTPFAKQFMVEKFNQEFGLDISYKFFFEKLDTMKKTYKKYKELLNSTGISVDPITSEIDVSESWWKDRETCKIVHAFRRKPPQGWDIMERCFRLYNVQSQSQYSASQRREEMRNEDTNEDMLYEDTYDGEMSDDQDPDTQENEEVYRVNINDETRPSNNFIRAQPRKSSATVDPIKIPGSRVQQRGKARRGSTSQRPSVNSVLQGSGSRGSKKKQSFETTLTDTMAGFREFQGQSLQKLRPNSFDQEDYDDFDVAFLQALTGFTRDDQYMGKRLSYGNPFGSPSSGGIHSGSLSSGGNNSWEKTANGQEGQQQRTSHWGTPPAAQQWGTPPSAQQWAAPQWGAPPSPHQWSTPPNSSQWGTTANAQQWSSPPVAPQWGSTSTAQQWSSPPVAPQWGTTSPTQPWSSPPTNVQYGFSLETQTKSTRIAEERVVEETPVPTSTNSQRRRGPKLNETHQTDSEDEA